jgi:GTP-binding protein
VVDGAGVDGRDPLDDYLATNRELAHYSQTLAKRPQLVAINKMDLPDAQAYWELLREALPADLEVFPISAATGEGVQDLMNRAAAMLHKLPPAYDPEPRQETLVFKPQPADDRSFTIEEEEAGFRVRGTRIERIAAMTNFDNEESADRFQRILASSGIEESLRERGIKDGDLVHIGKVALYWEDEFADWEEEISRWKEEELGEWTE